ncbi:Rid family detoxifying hydrolase [Chryseobacterium sp. CBSDS_008]|uniref:Rid family detoxifying hydrolase n=1 Tax=Chryseobacterium sp. CBSDS_008 TaxID=3415265 RepID=UPI003CF085EA
MNKILLFLLSLTVFTSCTVTQELEKAKHANLPAPIGPYSHSVSYGKLIFVSGQIGLDQKTNSLKPGIEEQAVQTFENLKTILHDNHSDLEHVTKTTIFMTDIKQFDTVNTIYRQYFGNHFPARSTIQVAALPGNAHIEIECIAVKKNK